MLCFHSFDKKKILIHAWTTKYKLYNLSDSAYELNALIFVFETALPSIKTNGKLYVNNLKFYILFT